MKEFQIVIITHLIEYAAKRDMSIAVECFPYTIRGSRDQTQCPPKNKMAGRMLQTPSEGTPMVDAGSMRFHLVVAPSCSKLQLPTFSIDYEDMGFQARSRDMPVMLFYSQGGAPPDPAPVLELFLAFS